MVSSWISRISCYPKVLTLLPLVHSTPTQCIRRMEVVHHPCTPPLGGSPGPPYPPVCSALHRVPDPQIGVLRTSNLEVLGPKLGGFGPLLRGSRTPNHGLHGVCTPGDSQGCIPPLIPPWHRGPRPRSHRAWTPRLGGPGGSWGPPKMVQIS